MLTIRRDGKTHNARLVRRTVTVPVASSKLIRYHGHRLGYLQFTQFTQGSARQLRAQVRRMLNKHPRPDPRPPRQRRRPARPSGRRRQHLHRGRHDRVHPWTQPADARLPRARATRSRHDPDGRAGRPRHRLVGRDRDAALQDRGAPPWSVPTPTERASSRRSSRSQRRRARPHGRRVLHAERTQPRRRRRQARGRRHAERHAAADRRDPGRALGVAERVLASKIGSG